MKRTTLLLAAVSFLWTAFCVELRAQTDAVIPTADQVGAACMPDTIAPIHAPFDMPQLMRPVFPDYTLTLTKRELKKAALVSVPIQKAIDENILPIYKGKAKLLMSELKDSDAAVLGASALGWELKDLK